MTQPSVNWKLHPRFRVQLKKAPWVTVDEKGKKEYDGQRFYDTQILPELKRTGGAPK